MCDRIVTVPRERGNESTLACTLEVGDEGDTVVA